VVNKKVPLGEANLGKFSNFVFQKLDTGVSENLGHHKRMFNTVSHIKIFMFSYVEDLWHVKEPYEHERIYGM
jgi:hypothetical protein